MMNFITNHAVAFAAAFIMLLIVGYVAYLIYTKQTDKLQKWLLLAVVEAEKQLQSGTGRIKLEFVYDLFAARFRILYIIMPRATFEKLVDAALNELKELLSENAAAQKHVEGDVHE